MMDAVDTYVFKTHLSHTCEKVQIQQSETQNLGCKKEKNRFYFYQGGQTHAGG